MDDLETFMLHLPCGERRHPKQQNLLLEVTSDSSVVCHTCPICGTRWTDEQLTEMRYEVLAQRSNQRDYEYPKGARGHFTGD